MLARIMFAMVNFSARKGLSAEPESADSEYEPKRGARQTGVRGETYAYWYLRRQGYVMVARNYTFPGIKGEVDIVGYDGAVLAFVEVKTRSVGEGGHSESKYPAGEYAVNEDKRRNLIRMARQFLRSRPAGDEGYRFDVLAIDSRRGSPPVVRLQKGVFTASLA